ncbi:MAG: ABC transporter permease [Candidatus Omnitrophota bacterium]|jgi:ABC-type polysaccharide/polyol phosphate export permease
MGKIKSILDLSLSLAKTRFKLRNEGTYLGVFWYLLEPLCMLLILLYIFSSRKPNIKDYPLYLLLGLIMFNLFSNSTIQSAKAITENAGFIKSLKISHEALVLSVVFQVIFTHFFEIAALSIFMIYFNINLTGLIFYPILLFFYSIFICGISFTLAAVGVRINDIANVWSVIVRLMWFATPLFYSISEKSLQSLLNPIAYFISAGRSLIINNQPPALWIVIGITFMSIISLAVGLFIFNLSKNKFAEYV